MAHTTRRAITRAEEARASAFLKDLDALSRTHGLYLHDGCCCCGGIDIYGEASGRGAPLIENIEWFPGNDTIPGQYVAEFPAVTP